MRSLLLLAPLLAAAAWGIVHLQPGEAAAAEPVHQDHRGQIESVALEGRGLDMPELRQVVASKAGNRLDDGTLARDREALRDALVRHGYLAAAVGDTITYDGDGGAFVTFSIARGALYHVRSIAVAGATAEEAGVVTIATGDALDADRLARARTALADRLASRGKVRDVRIEMRTDDHTATADVTLDAK